MGSSKRKVKKNQKLIRISNFDFDKFYDALSQKNFLIYPGKLTVAETFRIGCIGNLNHKDMNDTVFAIKEVLTELQMNIKYI